MCFWHNGNFHYQTATNAAPFGTPDVNTVYHVHDRGVNAGTSGKRACAYYSYNGGPINYLRVSLAQYDVKTYSDRYTTVYKWVNDGAGGCPGG
jgi:hypothetical protein